MLAIACLVMAVNTGFAQNKIGHINTGELLVLLPDYKKANDSLETFSKVLQEQLETMSQELQSKYGAYQQNAPKMAASLREVKEKELTQMQQNIEQFRQGAQTEVSNMEQNLLEPIIKKIKDSIAKVAKAEGYSYVIDTSTGAVVYFPDSNNLMGMVKKDLGVL